VFAGPRTACGDAVHHAARAKLERVVLATDFSACAAEALRGIGALASQLNAEVRIVHAAANGSAIMQGRKKMLHLLRELRRNGIEAEGLCLPDDPIETVLSQAAEWQADLIASGTKGRREPRSHFDDPWLAQSLGVVALAFILFAGGLDTEWVPVRSQLGRGAALSTFGVAITAGLVGLFATTVIGMSWLEGVADRRHRLLDRRGRRLRRVQHVRVRRRHCRVSERRAAVMVGTLSRRDLSLGRGCYRRCGVVGAVAACAYRRAVSRVASDSGPCSSGYDSACRASRA
jgi:hypothetical protein